MKKRINYIDIARAFAIIFIALGHTLVHSQHCGIIFKFLYSFHVVLFFIISGYTFKIKENEHFSGFLKHKFIRIMIPYFSWALLFLIPYMVLGENVGNSIGTNSSFSLKTQIINVLYGNGNASALKQNSSLWFLPALFSIEIIYYFIIKLTKKLPKLKVVILISNLLISYLTNAFLKINLPWGINTALVIGIFFYIGYLFNEYNLFNKDRIFKLKFILPLLIIGILSFYFNDTVSCIDYNYGSLTLALLSGIGLSTFIIYLSYLIKENKMMEYIGKNTMGILIFHKLIILIFQTKLGPISALLKNSNIIIELALSLVIVVLSIVCSLIGSAIIRKFMPILIGEQRPSPKN